jgi:selenocysteine lyase/cysteine desulfurase
VVLKVGDAAKLVARLAEENVIVSARGDGLRISFHYYNIPEDVKAVLSVLDRQAHLVRS